MRQLKSRTAMPANPMADLVLSTDPDLRRRLGILLLSVMLYPVNAGLTWWAISTQYMDAQLGQILIAYMLIGPAAFYGAMRSGLSKQLKDPSMVLAQSLFCVGAVTLGFAAVQVQFRGLVLTILPLVLMFGQFSLRPKQIGLIATAAIAALSVVTLGWWISAADQARHAIDIGQLLYIGGIIMVTSRVAQMVSRMRFNLERSRRELGEALAKMNEMATRDELTGLANRRRMRDLLNEETQQCDCAEQALSVAILDIDHFKHVNDTHGHAAGDDLLRRFSDLARRALREGDVLARWGGEEFLLLCPRSTCEEAEVALIRIRQVLQETDPLLPDIPELRMTFSAGVALHRHDENIEATLDRADQALYQAKADGRNRIVRSP